MYFWKYILAKKAGLSQQKCNMALYGLPVLPIAEAFEKTVTGNPISVTDALAQDALSLQVSFTPTQDGTPSIDSEPTTEPYLSKLIPRGNKEYYSLVGGTVAWNQLVQITDFVSVTYGGITGTNNGDGTYTVNGRARDLFDVYRNYELTANHVYFAMGCPQGGDPYTYRLAFASKTDKGSGLIYKSEYGGNETLAISISNGTEVNNLVFRPQLFDLTALFGSSAIADYIYSLEQATAGAGVQWLKDNGFFAKDYYPYNAGELISVNTSGHKIGSTTYPIDNIDLRGLFKLDANKLTCEGDAYPPSGSVERKYAFIDLGDLTYNKDITTISGVTIFAVQIADRDSTGLYGLCNRYEVSTETRNYLSTHDKAITKLYETGTAIAIRDSQYDSYTTSQFKTAMSGVYLVYELATPTTESATPYTSPIDVEAGGTEEFVDNRTVPIPVGNETYYASEFEIHGKTGVTVSHGATSSDTPTEYEVEFTSQGTVYGGTVDIVTGVLTVTWGYIASYNSETLTGRWISSKDVYAEGTTPSTGAEVACELAEPQTYNLTPEQVQMLLGDNYLETEDGEITITYMAGK